MLQKEIDLPIFVTIVSRFHRKLSSELLQDIVFRERPLELVISLQKNCAVVNARHVLEQAGIKQEELELIQLVKGGEGMLHFGDVIDSVQDSRRDQPLNRLFKITSSAALPYSTVYELLIGLGKLGDDAAEYHQDPPAIDLAIVLREVVFIDFDQFSLNLGNFGRIFLLHPGGNALRHCSGHRLELLRYRIR